MIELLYDTLRMAVRSLIRRPFYSAVAITILTLGLAASTTVVTYINSFFSPIPGINSERLLSRSSEWAWPSAAASGRKTTAPRHHPWSCCQIAFGVAALAPIGRLLDARCTSMASR